ncbi:MAG: TonB-dependent receptor, partial [Acidobacteria bacterium]|nr:TonB-dependent receptor [Acidobacteriota bacterium]
MVCHGQTSTSVISGVVSDSTGAVIPNARVQAVHDSTGVRYEQTTTDAGFYSFPSIPVGPYTVTVELKGFKTAKSSGNLLQIGSPIAVNFSLELGDATETVSVVSSYEQLQTSNATIGNVVERKAIVELPLNGRNPLNLLVLEPGVVMRGQGGAGTGVHVNGSRDAAFNTTIDGIEANESSVPNPLNNVHRLNPDNVQEYKVTTNNATPEEGRNSGASVSIATRSGTNQLHGTAFEFLRNTALNSNAWFANALGNSKPDMKLNQFGFELGGPIRKNRTFFFGSWQNMMLNTSQPINQVFSGVPVVYTPEALAGKYRYLRADPSNPLVLDGVRVTANSGLLVDPTTGALRAGVRNCATDTDANCIATYDMYASDPRKIGGDQKILKMLGSFPRPNSFTSGDGLNTAAYFWNTPYKVRGPNIMGRLDHTISDRATMFARYLYGDSNTLGGDPNNSRPTVFPGFPPLGEVYRKNHNLAISYRRMISPRIVNEFTAGLSRFFFLFTQGEANPDFPDIPPYAFSNISYPYLNRPRTNRAVTTPQLLDNLSVVHGAHQFRMGFNFRFYQHNDQRGQPGGVNVTPSINFSRTTRPPAGFATPSAAAAGRPGIASTDLNRLNSALNELLGVPAQLSQTFLGDIKSDAFLPYRTGKSVTMWAQGQRMKQYNFYFQDEWKMRRNLTVNYGVRYELNMAPSEAGDRVYVPQGDLRGTISFVHAVRWYQRNNGAIGPRLGITYSPTRKTVLRSGYGIAYDPIGSFQVTAVAGKVPGLTANCQSIPGGSTTTGCVPVPDLRINQGFPMELQPPATKPSSFLTPRPQLLGSALTTTFFDQQLKMPTVHQWNFNIQHELGGDLVAQAGYIGRRGTRLMRAYDVNQIDADPILPSFRIMQQNDSAGCRPDGSNCPAGAAGQPVPLVTSGILTSSFVNSSTTVTELRQNAAGTTAGRIEQTTLAAKLRPNQQFGTITYIDSGGNSYYHSFQATLRKRFSHGLQTALSYSLSKSIDDQSVDPVASSSGGGLSTNNSRTPTHTRNRRNERGLSDVDRTNVVSAIWLYELPMGRGKTLFGDVPAALNHVLGGWNLNGLLNFSTGEPFTITSGTRTSNYSHVSRAELVGPMPDASLKQVSGIIGPVLFADASAFRIPAPGANGMGRNMFRSPSYWNLDLGLQKNFQLRERVRLQLRAEAFNVFNHANFDNPGGATDGSNQITSAIFGRS